MAAVLSVGCWYQLHTRFVRRIGASSTKRVSSRREGHGRDLWLDRMEGCGGVRLSRVKMLRTPAS
jgi:hypothetical protein